ncbi:MAG: hypothetical protein IEMM0008_0811 [bacterium]|nr:MAG: hypothetical protein IEMM0008_0811 [bacterium]
MSQDMKSKVKKAIDRSMKWAETGWETSFGPRKTPANSLKQAKELPDGFSFKLEAVSHWEMIQEAGEDCAKHGKKALEALEKGNMKEAIDSVYCAQYLEKFYEKQSKTWKPVYEEMAKQAV